MGTKQFHKKRLALALASAVSISAIGVAHAGDKKHQLDIEGQQVGYALVDLGRVAGVQIILPQELSGNTATATLRGEYTLEGALSEILKNTGLTYEFRSDASVLIVEAETDASEAAKEPTEEEVEVDEEIVVTGSRIARTPSQLAANVIVLDARELLASGATTLEGALRQLPQNIFGATSFGAGVAGSGMTVNGALNVTGASTINLRGLGAESTLVLVDGKRIGKAGAFGGVSDISGIPLRSIERVEIMLDGGSSIYGSDAVGGVVNIITKKDFEGGDASYEYASSQLGGFEEHVFTLSGSQAWESGRINATFERYQRSNLDAAERPESVRQNPGIGNPGVIGSGIGIPTFYRRGQEIVSQAELLQTYTFADIAAMQNSGELVLQVLSVPPNQDGTNLSPEDLVYRDSIINDLSRRGFSKDNAPGVSLLPKKIQNSFSIGFDQALQWFGKDLSLSGNVYYSESEVYAADGAFQFLGLLPPNHPDNANLFPGSFFGLFVNWELPNWADRHYQTDNKVMRWNLSLDGDIGDVWRWSASAGQSKSDANTLRFNTSLSGFSPEFQELLDDGFKLLAGDLLEANSPELMQRLVIPETESSAINTENTLGFDANGALFAIPGGDVYMAVGGEWRQEILESASQHLLGQRLWENELGGVASVPSAYENTIISRTQRSLYMELLAPVVGIGNALPGMRQLSLTGSARYDSYQQVGSDSTWSLGMIWSPLDQVAVKVRSSTAYVAPTFRSQLSPTRITDFTAPGSFCAPVGCPQTLVDTNGNPTGEIEYLAMIISGGKSDLKPEKASILTAGIEISPDFLPGFAFQMDWSRTEYSDRLGSAPPIAERVFIPGLGFTLLADSDYDTKYGSTFYRREDGKLVWDQREINTVLMERSGIDYGLRYNRSTKYGEFLLISNVGHTTKFNVIQNLGNDPINQVADVDFRSRSVIPAYRYQVQLHWSHRGFLTSLNANTASTTRSLSQSGGRLRVAKTPLSIALVVTYDMDEGDLFSVPAWLEGTTISLKVPQLLNNTVDYQVLDPVTGEPLKDYAELNANVADPIGRKFHISLTRRF